MRTFAFVFARGGSKGLPGKNLYKLGGLPLVAHSIKIAQQVEAIDEVWVSTDDEEIAAAALSYEAKVIKRPTNLANDTASEWHAWQHAVAFLQQQGEAFDRFVSLPATAPLRSKGDVQQCLDALDQQTDMVVTVSKSAHSPYFNMISMTHDGFVKRVIDDSSVIRRQDAPDVYGMTTVAYVTRPEHVLSASGVFDGKVKAVAIPKERAVDIDDQWDMLLAEAIYGSR